MDPTVAKRAELRMKASLRENAIHYDRVFAYLLGIEWLAALAVAWWISPYAWEGKTQVIHVHVWLALVLGGLLVSLPWAMASRRPGTFVSRCTIAVAQMAMSALFIHLTGGRIETHFHVFGSLAFLAVYRDWRVLIVASVVVATEHFARGVLWPESVYGIGNPEWWRSLEHGFWVLFCDTFLVLACLKGVGQEKLVAQRQAEAELMAEAEAQRAFELRAKIDELELRLGEQRPVSA
ncbi:MAG TPA: hypothetical protein VFH51_16690 [Myxococcota bacterium]|nr:hypothetical protein [Myxococcota bacterium]